MAEKNNKEKLGLSLDDKKYHTPDMKGRVPTGPTPEQEKQMQKTREKLDKIKKYILKKFKFTSAIGIIPPQAGDIFDEENELSKEEKEKKPMHLLVVIPDDKVKEFNKIKAEIVKKITDEKQNIWLNLFIEKDLWEICMDSKYDVIEAIGMSFPIHDKGILGGLRVAQIHKSLVLKKFEKYVYSYVIGGSLVRGEVIKTSDVDVYIIIDDTDVKRMPRLELKEKLRNIIYSYVMQAGDLAGVKNKLSPQVYLLTEFWEGVKDANPIFYTFLRDGVPLYDRGGFLPWKLLLKMGKIRPSPESIDMFMSMGDKTKDIVNRKLMDIVMGDIYWGIITPSQAMLMLYGLPPTNVYETVNETKRIFVDKEKLLEKKYWEILNDVAIKYYKGYEHGKVKSVSGKEVDKLLKDSQSYLKRLKELRKDLEKEMQKKTFQELYKNIFDIMKSLFGTKSENALIKEFEKEVINKGKSNPKYLHTLKEMVQMKKNVGSKKEVKKDEFELLRKDTVYLMDSLVEYGQRKDLGLLEKMKVIITFGEKDKHGHAEIYLTNPLFVLDNQKVLKIEGENIIDSNSNEFNKALQDSKGHRTRITAEQMKILKKLYGDFDISL